MFVNLLSIRSRWYRESFPAENTNETDWE